MTAWAYWGSILVIVHTYLVFPALVLLRGRVRPRPHRRGDVEPRLGVVIAAHDEAEAIGPKLATVLEADYPADRLEVVVASDGSADATVATVRATAAGDRRLTCLDLPRKGKAHALNRAIDELGDVDVVVFTDANSLLEPASLRALVAPFADGEVGGVAGDQRYLPASGLDGAHGERSYWSFDRLLKRAQSDAGNVVGATGALYAVRRELVGPVPEGVTDDFTTSTAVIEQGRRLVFSPDAVAWEPVAEAGGQEYARKVRVMTRGLQGVRVRRRLLDPRAHGFYAYQLASHKVLRRLMGIPLVVLAASAVTRWRRSRLSRLVVAGFAGTLGAAAVSACAPRSRIGRTRICHLSSYFWMVNAAGVVAALNVVRRRRVVLWEAPRGSSSPTRDSLAS